MFVIVFVHLKYQGEALTMILIDYTWTIDQGEGYLISLKITFGECI